MSTNKEVDVGWGKRWWAGWGSLQSLEGAMAMDLWAPGYFNQSNSLIYSTGWHDPDARQLLVLRTMMTKNEKGLCSEVGKGEGAED